MTPRDVIRSVLRHERPPYVPWSVRLTHEAREKLDEHWGVGRVDEALGNHFLELGSDIGFFEDVGAHRFRDAFGVVWDRSVDRDIGVVEGCVLPRPDLAGYEWPDPLDPRFFADTPERIARHGDRYRVFCLGFSLFERAWTLRGMENLLIDFHDHPRFVEDLLDGIAEYDIAQVRRALEHDIDAVYFGDDWGQQSGLIMGYPMWARYLRPVLERLYGTVRAAGKAVVIHSCGDVDELFDDLIELGVDCFNPFQSEVMDTRGLLRTYRDRLSFWGGLSTQRLLPYGSVEDVRAGTRALLAQGRDGGLVFSPSHAVEGDVPVENILAFVEELRSQPGAPT